jgi:hypothetical protein
MSDSSQDNGAATIPLKDISTSDEESCPHSSSFHVQLSPVNTIGVMSIYFRRFLLNHGVGWK